MSQGHDSSLLFHAGQAAIKLLSAEVIYWGIGHCVKYYINKCTKQCHMYCSASFSVQN